MGLFADQHARRIAELSVPGKQRKAIGKALSNFVVDEILELSVGNFGVIGFVRSKIQFGSCPDFGGRGSRALVGCRHGGHK